MIVSVFATVRPRPEHLRDALAAIEGILTDTRAEAGCLQFDLHEGDGTGLLHLYEVWSDRDAFELHHAQPYTQAVYEQYKDWLAAPVELTFMRRVDQTSDREVG